MTLLDLFPYAGDADSDGVPDSYHSMTFGNSRAAYVESGLVSGRNGAKLWEGPAGIPVGAAIDGSGDDFVRLERSRRVVRVVAQDGATGVVIWRTQVSLRTHHDDGLVAIAADLTGDGRGEVIVKFDPAINDPTVAHTFVLDGATGEHPLVALSGHIAKRRRWNQDPP